jgi:3-deoxy-7-phosphoheptulonate synthase
MIAAGADGLILEVHPSPEHALCDGAQSLTFDALAHLMEHVAKVANAIGKTMEREPVPA